MKAFLPRISLKLQKVAARRILMKRFYTWGAKGTELLDDDEIADMVYTEYHVQLKSDHKGYKDKLSLDNTLVIQNSSNFLSNVQPTTESFPQVVWIAHWLGWSTWITCGYVECLCKKQTLITNCFKIHSPAWLKLVNDVKEKMNSPLHKW